MNASRHITAPVISTEQLRSAAAEGVGVLKVLANVDRLLLLCQLSQGEHCVSELENELGIVQPTLSQQLGVLRSEGVVSTRRQGKNIYYRVADPRTLEILVLLHRLYCPEGEA
jgi:DNA-binding transcriptional ArsR family regulator